MESKVFFRGKYVLCGFFSKIANGQKSLTIFAKSLHSRCWLDSKYASVLENVDNFFWKTSEKTPAFKDTLKAFNDFKNKQKSVWSNVLCYVKVYIHKYIKSHIVLLPDLWFLSCNKKF